MKVTLLDHTADPEARIGAMAAICYDSDTSREASIKRARKCKNSGHLATLRFAYATFNVSGISRICSHQIVRMAHAGILQRSQRYVKESKIEFVTPPAFEAMPLGLRIRWDALQAESRGLYDDLVAQGVKKEDARYTLLHSAETELNLCLNFQGWRDFLKNRDHSAAQWEVRGVALAIRDHLNCLAPGIFDPVADPLAA